MGFRTAFNPLGGGIRTAQKAFVYTVLIPSAAYSMPLPVNNGTYVNAIDVDWGDGSSSTLSSGAYPTHTYATAGSYQIRITSASGKIPYLYFRGNSRIYLNLTSVDYADVEFYLGATKQTSFSAMFNYCSKLTTVPATLFKNNETATTFSQVFYRTSLLTSVPNGLFANNRLATNFSNAFNQNVKLKFNPNLFCSDSEKATRFASVTGSVNFSQCFYRSSFSGTQGEAPDLWNYTFSTPPTIDACFGGAGNTTTSLSNYAAIPSDWR